MRPRPFAQVDVFTAEPLHGNPVAVVLDHHGLSTEEMLRFTDWTNLSEATFVGPPSTDEADYSVRIFCPGRELPFAGHPTLGTCHAWLEAGGVPRGDTIVQECGVGLVPIRRSGDSLAFAAPALLRSGPLTAAELNDVTRFLRIDPSDVVDHAWCDNGPGWRGLLLKSAEAVLAVSPDPALLDSMDVGIVGPHSAGSDVDFELRAFFRGANGLAEDPVTGSLNAAVAQWLIGSGRAPDRYLAAQGAALGRGGRITIEKVNDDIWVGGRCVTVLSGSAHL